MGLIRHERGLLLWDTGYPDALADRPQGNVGPTGTSKRMKKLVDVLASIGVKPGDLRFVAISGLPPFGLFMTQLLQF